MCAVRVGVHLRSSRGCRILGEHCRKPLHRGAAIDSLKRVDVSALQPDNISVLFALFLLYRNPIFYNFRESIAL